MRVDRKMSSIFNEKVYQCFQLLIFIQLCASEIIHYSLLFRNDEIELYNEPSVLLDTKPDMIKDE